GVLLVRTRARVRGLDLYELRRQFGRWQTGTWFEINDGFLGEPWKGKDRPFVLAADYEGGPLALGRPRRASRKSNFPRAAHDARHEPTCQIDCGGWINRVRAPLEADWLPAAYRCTEPESSVIERLRREK